MKIGLVYLNHNDGNVYPIGLLSLAAMLRQRQPQHTVDIIDANFDDPFQKAIDPSYDIIGISAMTIEYEKASLLAQHIKKHSSTPVILGGVHISTLPQSFRPCFDLGIVGEGEITFCDVIAHFASTGTLDPKHLSHIKGLVFFDGDKITTTHPRELIDTLDKIPKLDYSLLHPGYFRKRGMLIWSATGKQGIVLSSRGCPYKCVFCSTTQFWNKVRYFSIERSIEEISDLVDHYGADHIQIFDDLFTINRHRLRQFAAEFRRRELHNKVSLSCQSRTNLIDDELCEILLSLNVKIVSFGFESGNERMLNYLKCDSTSVAQNKKAIATCAKYGLKVFGSVIFGSPTETLAEMQDTLDFLKQARRLGATSIWGFVMTPFPATQVWNVAKSRGKVCDNMNFDLLTHQSAENPMLLEPAISLAQFSAVMKKANRQMFCYGFNLIFSLFTRHPFATIRLSASALLNKYFPDKPHNQVPA